MNTSELFSKPTNLLKAVNFAKFFRITSLALFGVGLSGFCCGYGVGGWKVSLPEVYPTMMKLGTVSYTFHKEDPKNIKISW